MPFSKETGDAITQKLEALLGKTPVVEKGMSGNSYAKISVTTNSELTGAQLAELQELSLQFKVKRSGAGLSVQFS